MIYHNAEYDKARNQLLMPTEFVSKDPTDNEFYCSSTPMGVMLGMKKDIKLQTDQWILMTKIAQSKLNPKKETKHERPL